MKRASWTLRVDFELCCLQVSVRNVVRCVFHSFFTFIISSLTLVLHCEPSSCPILRAFDCASCLSYAVSVSTLLLGGCLLQMLSCSRYD